MDRYLDRGLGPLLPIVKVPKVESTFYALRLTPLGAYQLEEVKKFMEEFTDTYVVSEENSKNGKLHYHSVICTEMDEDDLRECVRDFLKLYFPGKPKRGDANKQYNLSECIDVEQSVIYLLKDKGTMIYGLNVNEEALNQRSQKSYAKFSKADFAKELEEIKKLFKEKRWSMEEMMVAIVKLKAKYRQPIDMNYIYRLCLSCDIHNDPRKAGEVVDRFLSRLQ